jgi:hypothetical protein
MTADPPRPPRWRRRVRRILAALLLLVLAAFVLSNALLATPWLRGKLAAAVSARCGLETSIERAWWTPWGGVSLGRLRLRQPPPLRAAVKEPLLEIAHLQVRPRWREMLRGRMAIASIRIDRPRGVLALEMAATLVSAGAAETPPALPPVAMAAPAAPTAPPATTAGDATPPEAAPTVPPAPPAPAATDDTLWLELRDGSFEIRLGQARLASLRGIDAKIPCGGGAAAGEFAVGGIECLGRGIGRDLKLPLAWSAPELRCDAVPLQLAGAGLRFQGVAGLQRGLPFAVALELPAQALDLSPHFRTLAPAARHARLQVAGRGVLRYPSTWEGVLAAGAQQVSLTYQGQPLVFDEARASASLQGGTLHCPDLRLTGETVSLLGNGRVDARGQGTGVLRVVMPPDLSRSWSSRLTVNGKPPVFADLGTPDRRFIDLRWIPYDDGHAVELGEGGPRVPAAALARLLVPAE